MTAALLSQLDRIGNRAANLLLPTLARFAFAAVLAGYFWSSALTKFDGIVTPSVGAYAQIFPRAMEAAGYNPAALGLWPKLVVLAGGYAEVLLPALIVLGLATRLAALGMAGFIGMQSLTDIVGHGVAPGGWFDAASDAVILDQRALWLFVLAVLVLKGGGALSLDRVLRQWVSG